MISDGEAGTDEQVIAPDENAAASQEEIPAPEDQAAEETAAPETDASASAAEESASAPDEAAAASAPAQSRSRGLRALPGRASRRAGRIRPRWRIASMIVLVVLVAGVAVWDGLLTNQQNRTQDTQNAENAAMAAAKTDIEQILSYDYRNLTADLSQASDDTTGEFNGQFAVLASELITSAAAQQHTVTKATVPDVSVISSTGNQVVVLVFVDQSTTDKSQTKPQTNVSQVKATMENVGGRWLVEQFQAL